MSETQAEDLTNARAAAVETLSAEEKAFISSLEGSEMRDLTLDQKNELREIKDKLHEETIANITDAELKAEMEEHHAERVANRGSGKGLGNHQHRHN